MNDIESLWRSHVGDTDKLYDVDFLKVVEDYAPDSIRPLYVVVKQQREVIALLYFQLKFVRLSENLRLSDAEPVSLVKKAIAPMRNAIVKSIQFQTLICGNLLVTGSYGFDQSKKRNADDTFVIVTKAINVLRKKLESEGIQVELLLIKDIFKHQIPVKRNTYKGYTKFKVQPSMIFYVREQWHTMGDYVNGLRSKYRIRAKKAFESGQEIERRILSYNELVEHREWISKLYKNISDQASFNAFLLHPAYFENLKQQLGEHIIFNSYWLNGKMIAFYSVIINQDTLNAHFLGYNPDDNIKYKLYLNMLLEIIGEGIKHKMRKIDFSRTAIEIKSTVGAKPEDLFLFIKHNNPILNKSLETLIGIVNPEHNYIIRSPFKD